MLELGIKNIAMSTIKNICWMEIGKIRHVWMQCYSDDGWIFFFKIDCKVTFIWIPFQNQNGISRLVIGDSPGKNEIRADYSFFIFTWYLVLPWLIYFCTLLGFFHPIFEYFITTPPSPLLLVKILATEKCKHKANQPKKNLKN